MTEKPKTLLINFLTYSKELLKFKNKVQIEFGYIHPVEDLHFFPSPPYEYDIVIANLDKKAADSVEVNFPNKQFGAQDGEKLKEHIWNGFILAFLGTFEEYGIKKCGLDWLETSNSDKRDQIFIKSKTKSILFDTLIEKHKNNILLPVEKYIVFVSGYPYKDEIEYLLKNKDNFPIAAYTRIGLGDYEEEGETYINYVPNCLILPQFKDNLEVINDVFNLVIPIRPDLFPSSQRWLEEEPFISSEIKDIDNEIENKKMELDDFINKKEKEKEKIKEKDKHFTKILETDDNNYKGDDKLSVNVKKVLEFLGFVVEDIDEKLKKSIKKEDYWLIDENYFAICEVTGTVNKNPKASEYIGILGRIKTVLQRKKDQIPEKYRKNVVKGLLIINHDRNTQPFNRPKIYTGSQEELADSAINDGIGILSTVELFKISKDVRINKLTKNKARSIIKQPGRVIYNKE